jgi:hypothetical protein
MWGQSRPGNLTISIHMGALDDRGFTELQAHITASHLQNIRLLRF